MTGQQQTASAAIAEEFDTSSLEGQSFAAIDLGSNSFHMVVARYEHGTLRIIDRLKEMVRLAAGVDAGGELDPEVKQRAFECLARFGERIAGIPGGNVRAVGTNALRRMKNSWGFLSDGEVRLGTSIEIISGNEEARLIYLGVAHGISERGNQRLVIDVGGGSTEFVIGSDFSPILLDSLYFGCVAVTQKHFAGGKITAKRWKRAKNDVGVELQRIAGAFRACGWKEVLGSSGTMKAVRNVVVARGWSERGITGEAMACLRDHLIAVGHEEKLDLSGLSARRRPVFAGGAVVVETCLECLGIDQIIVTDYALREGLLYDMIGRILHADPRQGTVNMLMERYWIDRRQAERVRATVLKLYGQVAEAWNLSRSMAELLGWAADLHEIGLSISHHGYHRHGAYLIENSDLPGFSRLQQLVLAALVRNHRRKPDPRTIDDLLSRIQLEARKATALLRIAVLLNRPHSAGSLPRLEVVAEGDELRLSFPPDWLDEHPLVRADIEREVKDLSRLGIELEL